MSVAKYIVFLFLSFFSLASAMSLSEVNRASKDELMKIKGIGDAKADLIIGSRPFKSMQELDNVKGVGEALLSNIEHNVYKKSVSGNPSSSKSKAKVFNNEVYDEEPKRKKVNVIHFEK